MTLLRTLDRYDDYVAPAKQLLAEGVQRVMQRVTVERPTRQPPRQLRQAAHDCGGQFVSEYMFAAAPRRGWRRRWARCEPPTPLSPPSALAQVRTGAHL